MKDDLKCYIGMHRYRMHAEEPVKDPWGNMVGKALVSVCEHCGKVKITYVHTIEVPCRQM